MQLDPLLRSHKAAMNAVTWVGYGSHSGRGSCSKIIQIIWKNSVTLGCRTEVPVYLLAIG